MTLTETIQNSAASAGPLLDTDLSNLSASLSGRSAEEGKSAKRTASGGPLVRPECRPVDVGGLFAALHPECSQEYVERFQLLRTQLMLHRTRSLPSLDFRTLAVMSTHRGEGKSFTATNLAATLATNTRQGVLLIDGNPEGAELPLGVDVLKGGLTHALAEPDKWMQSIYSVKNSMLYVMPRGRVTGRSIDFSQLQRLLSLMRRQFEWVIFDGASFATSPDAEWFSSVTDGTVLVTQGGTVGFGDFQESLMKVPEGRMVGVVFNQRKPASPAFGLRLRFSGRWNRSNRE
jgi:Mrp family chromosome partitioning ATPase